MPYTCQQDLPHYYSNHPSNSTIAANHSNFNKPVTSSSPLQYHQHVNLTSRAFSVSPESSPSAYSNSMTLSRKATPTFCDDDMQPLDLSIHPNRSKPNLKRPHTDEHKPVCMVKSCTCCHDNTRNQYLSGFPTSTQSAARSPNTRIMFSHADSTFYTQQQTQSVACLAGLSNTTEASHCYHSQQLPSATIEASSFQHLTTSDNILNGTQNSPTTFHLQDNYISHDINSSHEDICRQEPKLLKQHNISGHSDNQDRPTYTDLDSSVTKPFKKRSIASYQSNETVDRSNKLPFSSAESNNEGKTEAGDSPHRSAQAQKLNRPKHCDSPDSKTAACLIGGVISHTSLERGLKRVQYPADASSSSRQAVYINKNPQEMYSTNASPYSVNEIPGNSLQLNTSSTCESQSLENQPYIFHPANNLIYSKATLSDQPPQPPSVSHPDSQQSLKKSPNLKGNHVGSRSKTVNTSPNTGINYSQLPTSTSGIKTELTVNTSHITGTNYFQLPTSTCGIKIEPTGNKHKEAEECKNIFINQQSPSEDPDNEKSTKMSLLDFWISKILMERSSEAPQKRKPCNVDYICTPNGEKKIRLRLVDLMELQVEQSLKA